MKNSKYKLLLITIKYFPWILAFIYLLGTILLYLELYVSILFWIGFTGIFPLIILYLSSIVFEFCIWHRLPLYYILICNILNLLNWIGITAIFNLSQYFIIFGFLILLGAYLKNIYNEKVRSFKNNSS